MTRKLHNISYIKTDAYGTQSIVIISNIYYLVFNFIFVFIAITNTVIITIIIFTTFVIANTAINYCYFLNDAKEYIDFDLIY